MNYNIYLSRRVVLFACRHVCPKTVFTVRDKIINYLVTPTLNLKQS